MRSINKIEKYFKSALKSERLKFTLVDYFLSVEVKTPLSFIPSVDGYKYTLVCAQDIRDFRTPIQLCDRITNMLTKQLLSSRQDVNGIMHENTLLRKDLPEGEL